VLGSGWGAQRSSRWADETVGGIGSDCITAEHHVAADGGAVVRAVGAGDHLRGADGLDVLDRDLGAAGMRALPPLLARARGRSRHRWQLYRYVMLPAMIPALIQGMKQGCRSRAVADGRELLFVVAGLGHLLDVGRNLNDINMVFA